MSIKCEYCGRVRKETIFVIGASRKADWVMHEGTGKIACPDCHEIGEAEGQKRIDAHVRAVNG